MKNNLLCDKKAELYKDGNFFNYFFLDITKEEWDDMDVDDFSLSDILPIDERLISELQIDRLTRFNGIWFLVRFKDVYRDKISQEVRDLFQETVDKQIKELKENPPEWASIYKDEYNEIIGKHKFIENK